MYNAIQIIFFSFIVFLAGCVPKKESPKQRINFNEPTNTSRKSDEFTIPASPRALSASLSHDSTQSSISFISSENNGVEIESYQVEYSVDNGASFSKLVSLDNSLNEIHKSYTHSDLEENIEYIYRVAAVSSFGTSSYSNLARVTTIPPRDTSSINDPAVNVRKQEEAARIEAERLAAEEAARIEAERVAAEEAARIEAERLAAEEAARIEAERLAAEEAARIEAERLAAEEAARIEAERLAAEEAARIEAERLAAEEAARIEAERLAAEEAARIEAERLEAEEAARIEAERLEAEEAARIEAERVAAEKVQTTAFFENTANDNALSVGNMVLDSGTTKVNLSSSDSKYLKPVRLTSPVPALGVNINVSLLNKLSHKVSFVVKENDNKPEYWLLIEGGRTSASYIDGVFKKVDNFLGDISFVNEETIDGFKIVTFLFSPKRSGYFEFRLSPGKGSFDLYAFGVERLQYPFESTLGDNFLNINPYAANNFEKQSGVYDLTVLPKNGPFISPVKFKTYKYAWAGSDGLYEEVNLIKNGNYRFVGIFSDSELNNYLKFKSFGSESRLQFNSGKNQLKELGCGMIHVEKIDSDGSKTRIEGVFVPFWTGSYRVSVFPDRSEEMTFYGLSISLDGDIVEEYESDLPDFNLRSIANKDAYDPLKFQKDSSARVEALNSIGKFNPVRLSATEVHRGLNSSVDIFSYNTHRIVIVTENLLGGASKRLLVNGGQSAIVVSATDGIIGGNVRKVDNGIIKFVSAQNEGGLSRIELDFTPLKLGRTQFRISSNAGTLDLYGFAVEKKIDSYASQCSRSEPKNIVDISPDSCTSSNIITVPNFNSLSIEIPNINSAFNELFFREVGDDKWYEGHPLWHDNRVSLLKGSVMNLKPNTAYEIRVSTGANVYCGTLKSRDDNFKIKKTIDLGDTVGPIDINEGGSEEEGYVLVTGKAIRGGHYGIKINSPFVIVRGLKITDSSTHGVILGDEQNKIHDVVIDGNEISNWGRPWYESPEFGAGSMAGIYGDSKADLHRITIQNNVVKNPKRGSNNWLYWNRDNGYSGGCRNTPFLDAQGKYFRCHPDGPQALFWNNAVKGQIVIRYNDLYSNNGELFNDVMGGANNISDTGFPGANSDIHGNFGSSYTDDGFEIEGGGKNIRIWDNIIVGEDSENGDMTAVSGLGLSVVSLGPIYIIRNQIIREGSQQKYYAMKQIAYPGFQGGATFFYHNEILNWATAYSSVGSGLINVTSRNNLINTKNLTHDTSSGYGSSFNYDGASHTGGGHGPESTTGLVFDNAITLGDKDRALDAGRFISNVNSCYLGSAPDIGYFEVE